MPYHSSNEAAVHLWEPSSLAIGCAAVVNRLAHFLSENLRRLNCCRCAADRDQGLLPQFELTGKSWTVFS
jgi:hypothetical protein